MQKLKSNPYNGNLSYQSDSVCKINWKEFIPVEIRDNLTPEDYVRRQRDYDREENIIFSSKAVQQQREIYVSNLSQKEQSAPRQ